MDINPEMKELRRLLDKYGIDYEKDDAEYGVDFDRDSSRFVNVEEPADRVLLEGLTHVEQTRFTSVDGRAFEVTYMWVLDDDDTKRFCSLHGDIGYLEVRVGNSCPYSAYGEEIVEDVLHSERFEW